MPFNPIPSAPSGFISWQRLKAKARELAFIHAGNEFVADVGRVAHQLRNSENRRQFFCIRSQDVMIYDSAVVRIRVGCPADSGERGQGRRALRHQCCDHQHAALCGGRAAGGLVAGMAAPLNPFPSISS